MNTSEFSPIKLQRKLSDNTLPEIIVAACDLIVRKHVGRPLFDMLINTGTVSTISRSRLIDIGSDIIRVTDSSLPFIIEINPGYVLSQTGLCFTYDFEILEESASIPEHSTQAMMEMCVRELFYGYLPVRQVFSNREEQANKGEVIDTATSLIPRYPNYYHWMVETVPRIRYLRAYESAMNRSVTALIPAEAPPFVEETLKLLDWSASKIKHATAPMYDVQNLVVPSYPERTASDFEWIREDILGAVSDQRTSFASGHNVYVSRSNAIERRVLNEEAVMDVLSEYGFSKYHLEDRSVQANARLFNEADVVVGPHGAGLTDIIFAEDCTLVELFGEKVKQPYRALADTLGIEYKPVYCMADSADIVVDTDELESIISRHIS